MLSRTIDIDHFLLMARSIAGETGHNLLFRLVETLSTHLNAVLVAVTYGEGKPPTHARASYALRDHKVIEDVHYALRETPCQRVYEGEVVTIPCAIAELYPREAAYEGYIGVPLRDGSGDVIGHLIVLTDTEIRQPEVATAICSLFAMRAEAELRRIVVEKERQRLISDLSRLNARLQTGYAQLRRENAQKTELMGLIAHDLRSPLSAIISQAELGLARAGSKTPDMDRIETSFTKVMNNSDRIARLIDATLERARNEGEALRLDLGTSNIVGLVGIATEANRADAERKSISVSIDAASEVCADVDETLVTSAIDNLVSNAVKYTHPGGAIKVAVQGTCDSVTVTVADTGQGMTPDDLQRAFGRFQTLSARPTGGETSTGLGLANAREIARAHGGTVEAESEGQGKGSRFRLVLPRTALKPGAIGATGSP